MGVNSGATALSNAVSWSIGSGTWGSNSTGTLTFNIANAFGSLDSSGSLFDTFTFAWEMTCANDVMLADGNVAQPRGFDDADPGLFAALRWRFGLHGLPGPEATQEGGSHRSLSCADHADLRKAAAAGSRLFGWASSKQHVGRLSGAILTRESVVRGSLDDRSGSARSGGCKAGYGPYAACDRPARLLYRDPHDASPASSLNRVMDRWMLGCKIRPHWLFNMNASNDAGNPDHAPAKPRLSRCRRNAFGLPN